MSLILGKRILNVKDLKRWESKITKPDGGEYCWMWIGTSQRTGYGLFSISGVYFYAHRLMYELTYGIIKSKFTLVMHSCDHKLCVNPEHLSLGTHYDNEQDKIFKMRQPFRADNFKNKE